MYKLSGGTLTHRVKVLSPPQAQHGNWAERRWSVIVCTMHKPSAVHGTWPLWLCCVHAPSRHIGGQRATGPAVSASPMRLGGSSTGRVPRVAEHWHLDNVLRHSGLNGAHGASRDDASGAARRESLGSIFAKL
jgi:hypothetical protein